MTKFIWLAILQDYTAIATHYLFMSPSIYEKENETMDH